jgi:hypothetical protein
MPIPPIAIEAIIGLAIKLLQYFVTKKLNDNELRAAFVQFAELARSENIKTILKRQKSEDQLKAANDKWDKIEEEEKNEKSNSSKH